MTQPARISRTIGDPLSVIEVEGEELVELYITNLAQRAGSAREQAAVAYAPVADLLAERNADLVQDKIFAVRDASPEVMAARTEVLHAKGIDTEGPVTYIEGRPCDGGAVSGVQLYAVAVKDPASATVTPLVHGGERRGAIVECWGARQLYLAAVSGADPEGNLPPERPAQAANMFENAREMLAANGAVYSQVARTWIYFPTLLEWYGEFNEVRNQAYHSCGFVGEGAVALLPASTGIQGFPVGGAECVMDVLAVAKGDDSQVGTERLYNPRQNEAFDYGSAFSRGIMVQTPNCKTSYISGAASIDEVGTTIYPDDPEGQIFRTLINIGSVIGSGGAGVEHIATAIGFFKKPEYYDIYKRIFASVSMPPFPLIPTTSDVCRDDLLFEIEPLAVREL